MSVSARASLSYKRILSVAAPIMLGSAAQNIVALSDSVFLFHLSDTAFAAIGLCSVFYLTMVAIGYGFSLGGQITIARQQGSKEFQAVGHTFRSILVFELLMGSLLFLLVRFGSNIIFSAFVHSPAILEQCLAFLHTRAYGLFFSFSAFAFISLYTGIARPRIIAFNTGILIVMNLLLNYLFIFGFGSVPGMGIEGAAFASNCAEGVAVACFVLYALRDQQLKAFQVLRRPDLRMASYWPLIRLSAPIVIQSLLSLLSWFLFFAVIEMRGERALAISNLARVVYLILSIPIWGIASATNTLVSYAIGRGRQAHIPAILFRISQVSVVLTMLLAVPILSFPGWFLYPLLGKQDMTLVSEARPIFWVMYGIMLCYSIGVVVFNGISGTGATAYALKIQAFSIAVYLGLVFFILAYLGLEVQWAWAMEMVYWALIFAFGYRYIMLRYQPSAQPI